MNTETKKMLDEFTAKAAQRLRDKKLPQRARYYIPSMETEVTIRDLTLEEALECQRMNEESESNRGDRYSVYVAVVEPDLKAVALQLKAEGEIAELTDVVDIFKGNEIGELALAIFELSGYTGEKIKKVELIKNS